MKKHEYNGTTILPFSVPIRVRDESIQPNPFRWDVATDETIFSGKRVIVVGLPGAFTPTCSISHLPAYEEHYDEFKALGIDEIYCISVNDPFVMFQWAKSLGISKVKMLPDGNGIITADLGMLVSIFNGNMGMRSWRYSMVVDDGVIEIMHEEPGKANEDEQDPFVLSDAATMLQYLRCVKPQ